MNLNYNAPKSYVFCDNGEGWTMMHVKEAYTGEENIIRCSICNLPAKILDQHYPWLNDYNRCEEHRRR